MSERSVSLRWNAADGGVEHCVVRFGETGITAEGVVVGGKGPEGFGLRWRITVDPEWAAFRSLHLTVLGGSTLALRHDGYGQWTDGEGKVRKDFSGVLDVDIAATPFGLAPMLRRQTWKPGRSQTFDVLAVTVPGLTVSRESRTVTCLEARRRFRIEDSEVGLDEDGLPLDWPGRVVRMAA